MPERPVPPTDATAPGATAPDSAVPGGPAPAGTASARAAKPGHDNVRGGLRFATELIAWVATPWALWSHSIPLAILADLLLIGLPAVFSTPGDRPGGDSPVAVPGIVTILLLLLQLVAATVSAWVLWPLWLAVPVTVLCLIVPFTELPRWRVLLRTPVR